MIGILGAMEEEVAAICAALHGKTVRRLAGTDFVCGQAFGTGVCICQCGVGKVNAAAATQILISVFGCEKIINTGIGCSLDENVHIGDAVVAGDLCEWDINITALGEARGYIEKLGTVHIPADEALSDKLAAAAAAQGLTVHRGTIVSGDTFVADSRLKKMLHATFGALCGEMEGAACAHTAALNGVPFAVLRCVSDGGDPDAQMDYPRFKKTAAAKSTATVLTFLQTLGKKEEDAG